MTSTSERGFHERIAALEAEHPSISDEQIQAIEAGLPKCPTCQGDITLIHFVAYETQRLHIQIDGSNGDVLPYSEHNDTLDRRPSGHWPGLLGEGIPLAVSVECDKKHSWYESRLQWDGKGEWTILP